MSDSLLTKYRPSSFDDVLGQAPVLNVLRELTKNNTLPPALLFVGDPGLGKTTLSRICASVVGAKPNTQNLLEFNGANKTGVDDVRDVIEFIKSVPIGPVKSRVIIVDECQRITGNAWDALLKDVEEPSKDVYWIFCSTNPIKIPASIKSRCHTFELKKVTPASITKLLISIAEKEAFKIDKLIIMLAAMQSDGSPRNALRNLSMVRSCATISDAKEILRDSEFEGSASTIEFCRLLARKPTWNDAINCIRSLTDDPETIRIIVTAYFTKIVLTNKSLEDVQYGVQILVAFSKPCNSTDKLAPIIIAAATALL